MRSIFIFIGKNEQIQECSDGRGVERQHLPLTFILLLGRQNKRFEVFFIILSYPSYNRYLSI